MTGYLMLFVLFPDFFQTAAKTLFVYDRLCFIFAYC